MILGSSKKSALRSVLPRVRIVHRDHDNRVWIATPQRELSENPATLGRMQAMAMMYIFFLPRFYERCLGFKSLVSVKIIAVER